MIQNLTWESSIACMAVHVELGTGRACAGAGGVRGLMKSTF